MKKYRLFLILLTAALLICSWTPAESHQEEAEISKMSPVTELRTDSDPEDPLMWSLPGTYLVSKLPPQKEIHDEAEAKAYSEEIWQRMYSRSLPEGRWEIQMDHQDESWHCSIFDENDAELYATGFLSNGVIQHFGYYDPDPRLSNPERRDDMADEIWEQEKDRISAMVEEVSPGILELVEPLSAYSFIDLGDKQYLYIGAMPLNEELDGCIEIIAVLYENGDREFMQYSTYGAG